MNRILSGPWNLFRIFRLGLGLLMVGQGIYIRDVFFILAGALFSIMALFNSGCCAMGSCTTPAPQKKETKDISYEEISASK
jgi:hypothetical protein